LGAEQQALARFDQGIRLPAARLKSILGRQAMFEDSTFESTGRIRTRSRAWGVAALGLNSSILAALIIIPLIYPEALPGHWVNIVLTVPPAPQAETPKQPDRTPTQAFHGHTELTPTGLTAPPQIPKFIQTFDGPEGQAKGSNLMTMDSGTPGGNGDLFRNARSTPIVQAEVTGPKQISSGVAEGMILVRTVPRYTPIAVATRRQGTVVLQATISTSGTIEHLRVVSGDPMLQQAALDAVSTWRYRPYLLDGKPVEVETTVNVVFSLGH
jgi:protein TonB